MVRAIITCVSPLIPPECAGYPRGICGDGFSTDGNLVCSKCGIVAATPEQVQQARAAAVADGTWPGSAS